MFVYTRSFRLMKSLLLDLINNKVNLVFNHVNQENIAHLYMNTNNVAKQLISMESLMRFSHNC